MNNSIITLKDVLFSFNLLSMPLQNYSKRDEVNTYLIDPNIANISHLETKDNGLDYDEVKQIFLSKDGDKKQLNKDVGDLLKIVMQIEKLMEKINVVMSYFGGVQINLNDSSKQITGGSKNFIILFLFSILYLLFLTPISMFVINSNARTTSQFPGNKINNLTLPSPTFENKDKYNDVVVQLANAPQNQEINIMDTIGEINDLSDEGEIETIADKIDNYLQFDKIVNVIVQAEKDIPIMTSLKTNFVNHLKKGFAAMKLITQKLPLHEKINILVSDVFDTNNTDLAVNFATQLTKIIEKFPTRLMTGLSIVSEINGVVTSPEFEVAMYATKHIINVMREDMEKDGKINSETLHNYLEDVLRIGGKKNRRRNKKTMKRNKKCKKSRKSKRIRTK